MPSLPAAELCSQYHAENLGTSMFVDKPVEPIVDLRWSPTNAAHLITCDQVGTLQFWDLAGEEGTINDPHIFNLSDLGPSIDNEHHVSQIMWPLHHPNWVGVSCSTHLDVIHI